MQSSYTELQQRRERIDNELSAWSGGEVFLPIIRALLDDADCGGPPSAFDIAKDTGDGILAAYIEAKGRYDRALSIAEKELAL